MDEMSQKICDQIKELNWPSIAQSSLLEQCHEETSFQECLGLGVQFWNLMLPSSHFLEILKQNSLSHKCLFKKIFTLVPLGQPKLII